MLICHRKLTPCASDFHCGLCSGVAKREMMPLPPAAGAPRAQHRPHPGCMCWHRDPSALKGGCPRTFTAEAGRNEQYSLRRNAHSQETWEQRALTGGTQHPHGGAVTLWMALRPCPGLQHPLHHSNSPPGLVGVLVFAVSLQRCVHLLP